MEEDKWLSIYREVQGLRVAQPRLEPRLLQYLAALGGPSRRRAELDRLQILLDTSQLKSIENVLHVFEPCLEVLNGDQPFENVYHAAIGMLASATFVRQTPDFSHAYRGQRRVEWPIVPTLYRGAKEDEAVDKTEYNLRLEKLRSTVGRLRKQFGEKYSQEQLVAICQHYGVPTWLLDVSIDPWVALYFASWGNTGDIGVVYMFDDVGWRDLDAGGEGHIGRFWKTAIDGIPRIEAQRAFFISGAHRDVFEGFVPFRIRFIQKPGLLFEDRDIGVSTELLTPEGDALADLVAGNGEDCSEQLISPNFPDEHLTLQWYETISLAWLRAHGVGEISPDAHAFIRDACTFHMSIQPYASKSKPYPIGARSLLRLKWLVESVQEYKTPDFTLIARAALGQYFFHAGDRAGELRLKLHESTRSSTVSHLWRVIETGHWKVGDGSDEQQLATPQAP